MVLGLPPWTYWEQVVVPALPGTSPATLPLDEAQLARAPGAETRWTAAPGPLRAAVLARGFAVTRPLRPTSSLGDFYASLRDDRVPWIVTLDALFFLVHVAMDRARAEVDDAVTAPSVGSMLRRLDVRLATESRGAPVDVASAYLVARGVVAVALSLLQPDYAPPPELVALVNGERSRIVAHSALATSPWLDIPLDYTAMAPRGRADVDEAHAAWFRCLAWLESAPLALAGRGERGVLSRVDVATARTHARAAILLSHVLQYDVDAEAASAWDRLDRVGELLVGPEDDVTARDLEAAARQSQLDPEALDWLANIVAVDHVRHAAASAHVALVDDGGGGDEVPRDLDGRAPTGRLSPTFRLVGPRVTPDSQVLQALVFPSVGGLTGAEVPPTARDGLRALPAALDVAAWLGSPEARAALRASGDDAYARYASTLDRLIRERPSAGAIERHRTPYHSFLDALETWLKPSAGEPVAPGAAAPEWRARKVEVALGAWTQFRHDAMAMSRAVVRDVRLPAPPEVDTPVPIFVEPHPEAIADLLALVRQTQHALVAEGAIGEHGTAATVLDEVQDLLWNALGVAIQETADQPVPSALLASLAAFPARLRALEAALRPAAATAVPLAVDVHADVSSGRVLEETLGRIEEAWMTIREPGTRRTWLALGAALPHAESVAPMAQRPSDAAWAARLASEGDPEPETLERAYFVPGR